METVKQSGDFTIYKKRSGRFGIKDANKKWVNGEAKVEILVKEGLVKAPLKKQEAPAEEPAAEAPAEETPEA